MDLARARREGIALFTHKASEGTTFTDPYFGQAGPRMRSAGFPVAGSYHVLWPNNPAGQADYWLSAVEQHTPWWRQHPCWIWQIDAELFQEFNPYRAPNLAEINACGDRIVARTGCRPSQVVVYGPEWLYGDALRGLKYRLWASAYGGNPAGPFTDHAPADNDPRWHPYSGQTPIVLQHGSNATIAGQAPADINVIRVASDAALQALFLGTLGDDMSAADIAAIKAKLDTLIEQTATANSGLTVARQQHEYNLDAATAATVNALTVQLAAQSAAIEALATKAGLDPAQLTAIIDNAVKNAVVSVDVNVHDATVTP